jgi:hypothetical protein
VGLVFSMQALGLIVGPLIALLLLFSGLGNGLTRRVLLGWGGPTCMLLVPSRAPG